MEQAQTLTLQNTWVLVWSAPGLQGMVSILNTSDHLSKQFVFRVFEWLPVAFSESVDICLLSEMPNKRNTNTALVPSTLSTKEQFGPQSRHVLTLVYKRIYFKSQLIAVSLISPLSFIPGKGFLPT